MCRVVTFGSPKAGNMQFAESVYATVGRTFRVVNRLDAVRPTPLCVLDFAPVTRALVVTVHILCTVL